MQLKEYIVLPLLGAVLLFSGCASVRLSGSISGTSYTSRDGRFTVPFPVSRDMGGRVLTDSRTSVTFRDNWGARITFTAVPIAPESPMLAVLQQDGIMKALTDFARRGYGSSIQTHFHPDQLGGTLTFVTLRSTGQKTGVAVFVHGHNLYLVETDLLPGVQMLGRNDEESVQERDLWLENRALTLAESMQLR